MRFQMESLVMLFSGREMAGLKKGVLKVQTAVLLDLV